jgi:formylglycine-generating enzyme required for sulfatase activity
MTRVITTNEVTNVPSTLDFEFVLIPAGEFIVGSARTDRLAQPDERPQHRLRVTDFHILRYPVTNAQYSQFVQATGHRPPLYWPEGQFPSDKADVPVVGVALEDAIAFCDWAAQVSGLPIRLPTEPEWEKAARGEDGRIYPWGNEWKPGVCNNSESRLGGVCNVGQFSPQGDSVYGVADMAGNVQEWCLSLFGPYPYDPSDGRETLVYDRGAASLIPRLYETGCVADPQRIEASLGKQVIRGGSWRESREQCRCAYRSWAAPMHRGDDTGFRCVHEPQG